MECIELGTIIGRGEDKKKYMTSMLETRIKLSLTHIVRGNVPGGELWWWWWCKAIFVSNPTLIELSCG